MEKMAVILMASIPNRILVLLALTIFQGEPSYPFDCYNSITLVLFGQSTRIFFFTNHFTILLILDTTFFKH